MYLNTITFKYCPTLVRNRIAEQPATPSNLLIK